MVSVCRSEEFECGRVEKLAPDALCATGAVLQNVATGEILFQAGDSRRLYRVEQGAICHYVLWADGRHDVIEFAFPGDIIGLGHLSQHVTTAQAMVDTVVSLVPESEYEDAVDTDDSLSFRQAAAVEREFDHIRDRTTHARRQDTTVRVANFLLALSSLGGREGRGADVISDDLTAGFVAEKLDMSIDALGAALLSLKRQGAVRETQAGLEIVDVSALQRFADAA